MRYVRILALLCAVAMLTLAITGCGGLEEARPQAITVLPAEPICPAPPVPPAALTDKVPDLP